MKPQWKFLVIGITGDLSKRKILPALAQFSNLNKDELEISLFGYSRSKPAEEEITEVLSENSLKSIEFVQGEYNDPSFFQSLISGLKNNERLIVYFAVPPIVFLDLLETFCPFYKANLDIIIEKPFGRDTNEAIKILQKIDECKLEKNIHFCDHYLFKSGLELGDEIESFLATFLEKGITEIHFKALEALDVKGRGGYYDEIGAIKDMLPAHLYSLLDYIGTRFNKLEEIESAEVVNVKLGQYIGYKQDVNNFESETDSYFLAELKTKQGIKLVLESGKKQSEKLTSIEIFNQFGEKIVWNIDPLKEITLYQNNLEVKKIKIDTNRKMDHTKMFSDLLNNSYEKFFKAENTVKGWKLYEKVLSFIKEEKLSVVTY